MYTSDCIDYVEGPSWRVTKSECKPALPPARYVQPMSRGDMRRVHKAIRFAVPELDGTIPFGPEVLDERWRYAMEAQTVAEFKSRYLNANLLKRYSGAELSNADDRKQAAVAKLLETEVRCAFTNKICFGPECLDRSWTRIPPDIQVVMRRARRIVHEVLGGKFPMDRFPHYVEFSPGATSEFPRSRAGIHNKWELGTHITPRALPYGVAFRQWCQVEPWFEWPPFEVVDANVVFTVEKNCWRDRTACKEPTWNVALQKGFGSLIREALQRHTSKLLLPDAQEYHGLLAKIGSRTNSLVTHDGESASDCWALGVVSALMPDSWMRVATDLRSPKGILPDGSLIEWEKLSTMGGGYTFEVQTLLFYAVVRAICGKGALVSVFGDDIIYPVKYFDRVTEVLMFLGISTNREKTFAAGRFRESCGGHYFDGEDVKPFYITSLPTTVPEVILLHNDVLAWHGGLPSDPGWRAVVHACERAVPRMLWGPWGEPGCLWHEWDACVPHYSPELESFWVWSVTPAEERSSLANRRGALAATLWSGGCQPRQSTEAKSGPSLSGSYGSVSPLLSWETRQAMKNGRMRATPRLVARDQWIGLRR